MFRTILPSYLAKRLIWISVLISCQAAWAAPALSSLSGTWVGDNPLLTRLEIQEGGEGINIAAFRDCETGECDWGVGEIRTARTSQQLHISAYFLSAIGEATLELQQVDNTTLLAQIEAIFIGETGGMESVQANVYLQLAGTSPLQPVAGPKAGITASPTGDARSTASLFQVSLYGPDDTRQLVGIQNLLNQVQFQGLVPGKYVMWIEAKGPTGVRIRQDRYEFSIHAHSQHQVEVELY